MLLGFSTLPEDGVILLPEGAAGGEPGFLEGSYRDVESCELSVDDGCLPRVFHLTKVIGVACAHGAHVPACKSKRWSLLCFLVAFVWRRVSVCLSCLSSTLSSRHPLEQADVGGPTPY